MPLELAKTTAGCPFKYLRANIHTTTFSPNQMLMQTSFRGSKLFAYHPTPIHSDVVVYDERLQQPLWGVSCYCFSPESESDDRFMLRAPANTEHPVPFTLSFTFVLNLEKLKPQLILVLVSGKERVNISGLVAVNAIRGRGGRV
ncbi:hypothetical protein KQX54_021660 [Cotesia glomerata]|uniref:Uncharacterized protein n=1 Tax=Cotesia glomerata TaxID=32391 RepID=A0AAV7J913_COTGL|nr:hypothetical protein KQX54_021660 [Cotesia glomerata]